MATGSRRIFPLHLTPIEKFLLADDRPEYPMTFVVDMVLTGTLDRAAFATALTESLARHPLLTSHIRPAKQNALCWVPSGGQPTFVDWASAGVPILFPAGEWINLHDETGLRIWIRQGADRVNLTVQFHHVCCDGIGAYRFLGDLLAIYGGLTTTNGRRPSASSVLPARLRGRADHRAYLEDSDQTNRQIRASLKLMFQIMGRGCAPLYPLQPVRTPAACLTFCSHTFSRDESKELRAAARASGGMLNDLLLLELFYTMHRWNAARWWQFPRRRYRVMMPVDLRDIRDYETPAANVIGYSFLTHTASDLRDRRRLAARIGEETALIKYAHLGANFVEMVRMGANVRGLLPLVVSMPRTLATVILSNVGDPSRRFLARFPRRAGRLVCGNLTLETIRGVPPMRPRTRGAFSISSYRKEVTISLRCDPKLFSLDDTQQLLDTYVDQLRQHLRPA